MAAGKEKQKQGVIKDADNVKAWAVNSQAEAKLQI